LKTSDVKASVGSNPTLSVLQVRREPSGIPINPCHHRGFFVFAHPTLTQRRALAGKYLTPALRSHLHPSRYLRSCPSLTVSLCSSPTLLISKLSISKSVRRRQRCSRSPTHQSIRSTCCSFSPLAKVHQRIAPPDG